MDNEKYMDEVAKLLHLEIEAKGDIIIALQEIIEVKVRLQNLLHQKINDKNALIEKLKVA